MDKYQTAIVELVKASNAVKEKTKQIGKLLQIAFDFGDGTDWLKNAYEMEQDVLHTPYGEINGDYYYTNHDGDIDSYLSKNCEHYFNAHQAIQERKILRKKLGIAKRRISALGNGLIKSMETDDE